MNGRKKHSSSSGEDKDGSPLPFCGDKEWEVAEPAKNVEHINEALNQSKVNVFVAGTKYLIGESDRKNRESSVSSSDQSRAVNRTKALAELWRKTSVGVKSIDPSLVTGKESNATLSKTSSKESIKNYSKIPNSFKESSDERSKTDQRVFVSVPSGRELKNFKIINLEQIKPKTRGKVASDAGRKNKDSSWNSVSCETDSRSTHRMVPSLSTNPTPEKSSNFSKGRQGRSKKEKCPKPFRGSSRFARSRLGKTSPSSKEKLSKKTTSSSATSEFSPSLKSVRRQKNPPIINEVPVYRILKKNQFLDEKFADSTTLFDEVMEVLKEVLAEFEDKVEVVSVKSILEETSPPVDTTDTQFYMAFKTDHAQDQRGGFVVGFESESNNSVNTSLNLSRER